MVLTPSIRMAPNACGWPVDAVADITYNPGRAIGARPVRGQGWSHPTLGSAPHITASFRAHHADTGRSERRTYVYQP